MVLTMNLTVPLLGKRRLMALTVAMLLSTLTSAIQLCAGNMIWVARLAVTPVGLMLALGCCLQHSIRMSVLGFTNCSLLGASAPLFSFLFCFFGLTRLGLHLQLGATMSQRKLQGYHTASPASQVSSVMEEASRTALRMTRLHACTWQCSVGLDML